MLLQQKQSCIILPLKLLCPPLPHFRALDVMAASALEGKIAPRPFPPTQTFTEGGKRNPNLQEATV